MLWVVLVGAFLGFLVFRSLRTSQLDFAIVLLTVGWALMGGVFGVFLAMFLGGFWIDAPDTLEQIELVPMTYTVTGDEVYIVLAENQHGLPVYAYAYERDGKTHLSCLGVSASEIHFSQNTPALKISGEENVYGFFAFNVEWSKGVYDFYTPESGVRLDPAQVFPC